MLQVRTVTPEDWPMWRELRLAALADAPQAFRARLADWPRGGVRQWWARLATPGTFNVAALLDGRPIGLARGVPRDDGASELRSVWVGPRARGRGAGDLLIEAVEAWAVRSGSMALRLAVFPANEPAVALYRRHGFAVSEEPGGLLSDGVTRELVMVKALR